MSAARPAGTSASVDGEALPRRIETVIVGAGHAGLSMSSLLGQAGREHIVLERRDRVGGGWLDRWDEFRLVTPNFVADFPGFPYAGPDPDGFMPRDAIADHVAAYARLIDAPVRLGTSVERMAADGGGPARFRVTTNRGDIAADRVVVATGGFHAPKRPGDDAGLDPSIFRLHAHAYRREAALPPGAVLVVGTGQTGVQIAEELHAAGRQVYLSVGKCGRIPRRYRGRDIFAWLVGIRLHGREAGTSLLTVETLPNPLMRFGCNPHLSGHAGGHDTNLRRFAAEGMRLVGRFEGFDGTRARFGADLQANLDNADRFFDNAFRDRVERYIAWSGVDAPPDDREPYAFDVPEVTELDLVREGISTVLWTNGYRLDYGWIELDIFDANGVPRQIDGMAEVPGLSFIGLPWMRDQASATLFGPSQDAPVVADRMETARARH